MFSYMIASSYGSSIRKTKILPDSDTMVSMASDSYYLKMQGEEIVIYENNDVIFETNKKFVKSHNLKLRKVKLLSNQVH